MKQKKTIDNRDQLLPIEFCTECGDDLENFTFTSKSKSKKEVQDNFSNCKKIGKFKGDLCSKVFISEDEIFLNSPQQEED